MHHIAAFLIRVDVQFSRNRADHAELLCGYKIAQAAGDRIGREVVVPTIVRRCR